MAQPARLGLEIWPLRIAASSPYADTVPATAEYYAKAKRHLRSFFIQVSTPYQTMGAPVWRPAPYRRRCPEARRAPANTSLLPARL
eukprot:6186695-Pleurochrysis_carterae.AAC.2